MTRQSISSGFVTTVALTDRGSTKPLYHVSFSIEGSTYSGTGVGVGDGVSGTVGVGVAFTIASTDVVVASGEDAEMADAEVETLAAGVVLQAAKAVRKTATEDIANSDVLNLSVLK